MFKSPDREADGYKECSVDERDGIRKSVSQVSGNGNVFRKGPVARDPDVLPVHGQG
ncbi:MAG: hypothetical protein H6Q48_3255 [Deltaproteobacteria bacterium]|nr:hypothetical protein [Deltaproteobacteria bacterium]